MAWGVVVVAATNRPTSETVGLEYRGAAEERIAGVVSAAAIR